MVGSVVAWLDGASRLSTPTYCLPPIDFIYLILTCFNSLHKKHGNYETFFNFKNDISF